MSTLPLTTHARERRRQRKITEHQIEAALDLPDCKYTDGEMTVYRRDGIMVFVAPDGSIVTVGRYERNESTNNRGE